MNFKYAVNSILKKLVFSILTIIQLSAIVVLLYILVSYKIYTIDKISIVDKIFPQDNIYHLELENPPELETIDINKSEELMNFLKEQINCVSIDGGAIRIEDNMLLKSNKLPLDSEVVEGVKFSPMYGYKANKDFFTQGYLKTINGESIKDINFDSSEDEPIKVIVGYNFNNKVKVGDIIKYIEKEDDKYLVKEMEVSAILEKDSYVSASTSINDFLLVDDSIIKPFEEKSYNNSLEYNGQVFSYLQNAYFSIEDENKLDELQRYLEDSGFQFKVISLKDTVIKFKETMRENVQPINSVFIFVIIFTGISIITSMISMIIKSIEEYSIHLLLGCTIKNIIIRIIIEIGILFSVSYLIGLSIINTLFTNSQIYNFNIKNAIYCGSILLIFMVITLIFPVLKMKKYSIEELIRSEQ